MNVDLYGGDVTHDLNRFPWPWADGSADEVLLHNVLEHLPDTIGVMKELYRVCKGGSEVHIAVPHPRHDDFISDPTHCSPITSRTMELFSKRRGRENAGHADTPLAEIHGVDFEVVKNAFVVEERWMRRVELGRISEDDLRDAILTCNNVVKQIEMTLMVIK